MTELSTQTISTPVTPLPSADEAPSLQIGGRTLPSRYFLAPLAGYTHLAFRTAIRELGGMGLATTDLVHALALITGRKKSLDLVATSPADRPLSVQIFGGVLEYLVQAARWLEARDYGGIDINMGCPMAKVTGEGGGARLMCDVDEAVKLVAEVVEAVDLPVTVKLRLGWDRDSITAPLLAREFESVGAAAVTIHGRTRQQGFHGTVDVKAIRETVEAVHNIPVIGNGDVRSVADAFRMRRETGCAAVAIGRGAMLDPWIFRKIEQAVEGSGEPSEPTPNEQIEFLVRHFSLMTQQHGAYSCTLFRKFAGWYGARLGIPEDLEDRLRRFESVDEFKQIVAEIRKRHGQRQTTVATALVKVPNGPIAHW